MAQNTYAEDAALEFYSPDHFDAEQEALAREHGFSTPFDSGGSANDWDAFPSPESPLESWMDSRGNMQYATANSPKDYNNAESWMNQFPPRLKKRSPGPAFKLSPRYDSSSGSSFEYDSPPEEHEDIYNPTPKSWAARFFEIMDTPDGRFEIDPDPDNPKYGHAAEEGLAAMGQIVHNDIRNAGVKAVAPNWIGSRYAYAALKPTIIRWLRTKPRWQKYGSREKRVHHDAQMMVKLAMGIPIGIGLKYGGPGKFIKDTLKSYIHSTRKLPSGGSLDDIKARTKPVHDKKKMKPMGNPLASYNVEKDGSFKPKLGFVGRINTNELTPWGSPFGRFGHFEKDGVSFSPKKKADIIKFNKGHRIGDEGWWTDKGLRESNKAEASNRAIMEAERAIMKADKKPIVNTIPHKNTTSKRKRGGAISGDFYQFPKKRSRGVMRKRIHRIPRPLTRGSYRHPWRPKHWRTLGFDPNHPNYKNRYYLGRKLGPVGSFWRAAADKMNPNLRVNYEL